MSLYISSRTRESVWRAKHRRSRDQVLDGERHDVTRHCFLTVPRAHHQSPLLLPALGATRTPPLYLVRGPSEALLPFSAVIGRRPLSPTELVTSSSQTCTEMISTIDPSSSVQVLCARLRPTRAFALSLVSAPGHFLLLRIARWLVR